MVKTKNCLNLAEVQCFPDIIYGNFETALHFPWLHPMCKEFQFTEQSHTADAGCPWFAMVTCNSWSSFPL